MEQPIYSSRRFSFNNIIILVFPAFLLVMAAFLAFGTFGSDRGFDVFLSLFLVLLAMPFLLLVLFKTNIYKVYPDYIRILSFLGREKQMVMRSQLRTWTESKMESRGGPVYTLTLYTDTTKVKISSNFMSDKDYATIKEQLTKGLPEDLQEELRYALKQSRQVAIALGVVIFLAFLGFLKFCYSGLNDLHSGTFHKKSGLASASPTIVRDSKGKGTLYISLKGSRDSIEIDDYAFNAMQAEKFANEIQEGDTITFDIVTANYGNALASFFGSDDEMICGIVAHGNSYLTPEKFMSARKHSHQGMAWIFLVAPAVFGITYLGTKGKVKAKRKQLAELEKVNAAS
jgi:hypothetical protein